AQGPVTCPDTRMKQQLPGDRGGVGACRLEVGQIGAFPITMDRRARTQMKMKALHRYFIPPLPLSPCPPPGEAVHSPARPTPRTTCTPSTRAVRGRGFPHPT